MKQQQHDISLRRTRKKGGRGFKSHLGLGFFFRVLLKLKENCFKIFNLIYAMTSLKNQQFDGGHATETTLPSW